MLVGILGYSEWELMAKQSERMSRTMQHARHRFLTPPLMVLPGPVSEGRNPARVQDLSTNGVLIAPLVSQELTAELQHLTADMLTDVTGWAQLSRVKALGVN